MAAAKNEVFIALQHEKNFKFFFFGGGGGGGGLPLWTTFGEGNDNLMGESTGRGYFSR